MKKKIKREVFHDRENSEDRFSQFSNFMKGFKKYIMNIYPEEATRGVL